MGIYIAIVWVHFIADYILQTDNIAINKSKNIKSLIFHCLIYSIPLFIFGWKFAIINGILHFCVDYVTSKISANLWMTDQRHLFFITLGFDQAVHLTCLFLSINCITTF